MHSATSPKPSHAAAVPVCVSLSLVIERVAYRPLRHAPRLAPLITAIGVSILIETLAMLIWGRNYLTFPQLLPEAPLHVGAATISVTKVVVIVLAALIMGALLWLVQATRLGRAMRATAENPRVASLMGVNPDAVIAMTFAIGAGLAAVAGVMIEATYQVAHFYMGFIPGLKAFTAAVLGGIGSIPGAMLGGFFLGIVESVGPSLFLDGLGVTAPYQLRDLISFTLLIMVLIFRPQGLLGEPMTKKRA